MRELIPTNFKENKLTLFWGEGGGGEGEGRGEGEGTKFADLEEWIPLSSWQYLST